MTVQYKLQHNFTNYSPSNKRYEHTPGSTDRSAFDDTNDRSRRNSILLVIVSWTPWLVGGPEGSCYYCFLSRRHWWEGQHRNYWQCSYSWLTFCCAILNEIRGKRVSTLLLAYGRARQSQQYFIRLVSFYLLLLEEVLSLFSDFWRETSNLDSIFNPKH